MKKYFLCAFLLLILLSAQAQSKKERNMRLQTIEDKLALKELVDVFSILADKKEVTAQLLLFTEDASVETLVNGQIVSSLKGRKQIGDAFTNFLNLFQVVYHINGQQTVTINGNKATSISYCAVTLIGEEKGKKMKTSMGVYYNDEYVKENGKWLIAKRQSTFAWRDMQPMN